MNKKDILTKCDYYIELFKDLDNVERSNILEFLDFAYIHLPNNSNLAFEINELREENFSAHAKRIKDFINSNGSKSININKNILSDLSNAALISVFFTLASVVSGVGYYFGTEKTNSELIIYINENVKLKDSLSIINTAKNHAQKDINSDSLDTSLSIKKDIKHIINK